jgi:hypothetical protein
MRRLGGVAILLAFGLASCAKPPVVAVAPPPPPAPVGHVYPVMVQVPPSPYKRHPLSAEQQAEIQQAFNVIALKSSLMVGALACNQQSQYDTFMTDFQPHILAEQHVMDAYFRRIGGYYGQAREDDFVTLMANNQSVTGIGEGAVFCLNNQAEFNQVLQFKSPSDLDNFVTDQSPTSMMAQTGPVSSVVPPPVKKPVDLADDQAN